MAAPVLMLSVTGAIGPATADYVAHGLSRAATENANLVVIELDTPGGLDVSMRAIIRDILASPVPVAAFVAPRGARAASAGTFILYAAHVAAMAPATNLGAATPVQIGAGPAPRGKKDEEPGDAMAHKAVQDASAYIRGLAQLRGRNADWAERAVRGAESLSADEALKLKVVDLVAADVPELLKKLDGRTVATVAGERRLVTAGAQVEEYAPNWRTRFLSTITNPSIAYVLVLIGIYAILYELSNPGLILPGVAGTIAVLIALYAFHLLPVNYAGLALMLAGIGFMIGGFAAATAAFLLLVVRAALRTRRRRAVSGAEAVAGETGIVIEDFAADGWAHVGGETWRVHSEVPLKAGARVRVRAIRGLVLDVVPETSAGE